jgi:hypothetical protein
MGEALATTFAKEGGSRALPQAARQELGELTATQMAFVCSR